MNNAGIADLGLGVFRGVHSQSKSRFSKIETMSIEFRPLTSAQKHLSIFNQENLVKIYNFAHITDDLNSVKNITSMAFDGEFLQ